MSIKVDITSTDVDRQLEVLKHFPDIADRRYRPMLKKDTSMLAARIAPNIPRRTGAAAEAFGSRVSGRAFSLKGRVGWFDKGDPWYINVVEHGAAEHTINVEPVNRSALAFRLPSGEMAFSMGHDIKHPGFGARGFMAAGYEAIGPTVENDIALANEQILADLAAI